VAKELIKVEESHLIFYSLTVLLKKILYFYPAYFEVLFRSLTAVVTLSPRGRPRTPGKH